MMVSFAYIQPILRPASPWIFENVRVITTLGLAETSSIPAS